MVERKKIAAVITEYRPLSHADVIVTKFMKGFPTDDGLIQSRVNVVSMYVDQFAENELSRTLAAEHGVQIYPSIVKALTLGGEKLAVDGVLLIGEHGDYAWNEKDQNLYPRKYFMEQICGVFARSGRSVPIFCDKHLSYNWHDAKWMVDRAAQLEAPFMAGSSLPLTYRNPWLEHELGAPIQEAIAIGYSGLDVYGFHTLESMIERRLGGETGVAAVTCLEGDAVWDTATIGLWSYKLASAACDAIENKPAGSMEEHCKHPALFLLEYRDGVRGAILMLNSYVTDFAYACRVRNEIYSTEFYLLNRPPHPHFSYLSLNIEEMFVTGEPTHPVERTLLTTGVLEAALESRYRGYARLETPHLDIAYHAYDSIPWRPTRDHPVGASFEPLPSTEYDG